MRGPDAVRFRDDSEPSPVAVKAPRSTGFDEFQARLVVTIKDLIGHTAVRTAAGNGQGAQPVPGDIDDCDQRVGQDCADGSVGLHVFRFCSCHGSAVSFKGRSRGEPKRLRRRFADKRDRQPPLRELDALDGDLVARGLQVGAGDLVRLGKGERPHHGRRAFLVEQADRDRPRWIVFILIWLK